MLRCYQFCDTEDTSFIDMTLANWDGQRDIEILESKIQLNHRLTLLFENFLLLYCLNITLRRCIYNAQIER